MKKFLKIGILGIVFTSIVLGAAGFLYWQSLKDEPQYALASIVDAARRNDDVALNELVDSDAVVDSLVPQITVKAVEIYGRGLAPGLISKIAVAASPLIPGLKELARAELPKLIRRETERIGDVAFPMIVLGGPRYIDIRVDGDKAFVKTKDPEHPTEIIMTRREGKWRVTAVRDERIAADIAQRAGQEIIGLVDGSGSKNANFDRLLKQIEKAIQ